VRLDRIEILRKARLQGSVDGYGLCLDRAALAVDRGNLLRSIASA